MNGEAHFNEVFLNDVRVPAANVVGEVGNGWTVTVTTLTNERVAIAGGSGMSDPDRLLANVNTPADYAGLEALQGHKL